MIFEIYEYKDPFTGLIKYTLDYDQVDLRGYVKTIYAKEIHEENNNRGSNDEEREDTN